ncbi:MAG TPA: hypothetical protein VE869_15445 [Gemmatimonas sp.]|nr:hypothetical protein [Gemmatimonas sp.]
MTRSLRIAASALLGAAAVSGLTACNDLNSADSAQLDALTASAFSSAPLAFSEVASSYAGDGLLAFAGERGGRGPGRDGRDGGPGLGFMGGGLGDAFAGGPGAGRGHERGPFRSGIDIGNCTFNTPDVTCAPMNRNGIVVTRTYTFKTEAGAAQARPDSTTDFERSRIETIGEMTSLRRDSITVKVSHKSDRTVTGIDYNSPQRTVNGTTSGIETTTGVNRDGVSFKSVRETSDQTDGVVIPANVPGKTYPTAGTVRRTMKLTLTLAGGAPVVTQRSEVVTYTGDTSAAVVITVNGTTKTCSLPLPRGRLSCPD